MRLTVERTHGVDRLVQTIDQPLAFIVGESQVPHAQRNLYDAAGQRKPVAAMVSGTLLLGNVGELLFKLASFLISLSQLVDFSGEFLQTVLQDFIGNLFLIKSDHFLDGADTLFEILPHREQLVNHNGRTRKRLQNPQLPALNALGNFNFTFAS